MVVGDSFEGAMQIPVRGELFGSSEEPGVNLGVNGAQLRLQLRRVALRIANEEAWVDAKEARQKFACRVREMRPGAALKLRKIRLTQAAAGLALHGGSHFLLGHGPVQAAKGAFDGAKGTDFVTEGHIHTQVLIAICKDSITICYYVKKK